VIDAMSHALQRVEGLLTLAEHEAGSATIADARLALSDVDAAVALMREALWARATIEQHPEPADEGCINRQLWLARHRAGTFSAAELKVLAFLARR
jgi:hypothetical protein